MTARARSTLRPSQETPMTVPRSSTQPAGPEPGAPLRRLFWRIHFWAGLLSAPIVLFAAATGLLYALSPQIEAWRHARVDRVPVGPTLQSLDAQVAAVRAAFAQQPVRYVVPAFAPGDTTQVYLQAPQGHHAHHGAAAGTGTGMGAGSHDHGLPDGSIAYVDPYTATVVGRLHEMQRFKTWARKLHSSALQGEGWRWLLELGASWMLVMFATGLVLWWPRPRHAGGRGWGALRPQWGRGRVTWRDLHALAALALGLVLALVLVTGLTWTRHAGANFRLLQQSLGQQTPRPPATLQSTPQPGQPLLGWQDAWQRAAALAPPVSLMLTPPQGDAGVWRAENHDRSQPTRRFTLALDAWSGEPLFRAGWSDLPPLAQATAAGIPFHRGEFGLWNQALLVLAALAAGFSVLSGLWMWWLRRPRGRVGAPPMQAAQWRAAPVWLWPVALGLAVAMPVFGWSLLLLALLEAGRLGLATRRLSFR
jgi:uncharacterized iron-regulated membrane protein